MTHDELLAKIEALDGTLMFSDGRPPIENVGVGDKINLALRAVIELHKPVTDYYDCYNLMCKACSVEELVTDYPCPTIQAIQKELK